MIYQYVFTLTPSVTFFMNCHNLLEVGFVHVKLCFTKMNELTKRSQKIQIRMIEVIELHIRLLQ